MRLTLLLSSALLTLGVMLNAPPSLAHVGHGDEFQAEGGVNRVQVKAETDSLLGIQVTPIESAVDGSGLVLIPVTALVDDNGRQLVFVQYENFYEPVDVTVGATQGNLIEITDGLSVGEQLVTQGSLTLYAESRKTQTTEAESAATVTTPVTTETLAASEAPLATSEISPSDVAQQTEAETTGGFPVGLLVGLGVIAAAGTGTIAVLASRKKKRTFSEGTYSDK
jgi:cation efflux system membrane fusion protein